MLRFTILLLCLFGLDLQAQFQPANILTPADRIIVEYSPELGKVYYHTMEAKETVYSLAKTFGQKPKDLNSANPNINMNNIRVGQTIKVPFISSILIKNPSSLHPKKAYVPVYYKVVAKDNFFRIARVYFNQTIENLLDINHLETFELKIDQLIQVGWISLNNHPDPISADIHQKSEIIKNDNVLAAQTASVTNPSKKLATAEKEKSTDKAKGNKKFLGKLKKSLEFKSRKKEKEIKDVVDLSSQLEAPVKQKIVPREKIKPDPVPESGNVNTVPKKTNAETAAIASSEEKSATENVKEKVEEVKKVEARPAIVYKTEKGIAIWNQTSSNSKNLFALHPTAKVGTFIEITNPMMNKTVQAKVIGNIPPRTYTDDVSLVISPRVAKMLGVVDRRFRVEVKFQE